jgi:hypothetical protein
MCGFILWCTTSNMWWACHGGAIEQASKVTNAHREQAQHEGWRHRHASEGNKEVGLAEGLTNGLVDMKVILSNTSWARWTDVCWGRKRGSSLVGSCKKGTRHEGRLLKQKKGGDKINSRLRHFIKQVVCMSGLADLDMPTMALGNPGYTGASTARRPAAQAFKINGRAARCVLLTDGSSEV